MTNDQQNKNLQNGQVQATDLQGHQQGNQQGGNQGGQGQSEQKAPEAKPGDVDGLRNKKPEELTPEELRLMADTMPGEGPGD
ncbi:MULTISPECIES: hypothetical protein [unclassified Massilia]|uniref:hypothetical protein n=1 Tax=unclassified Massilia TaxID=2609279 RepID=UPI001B841EBD|nr:MULTISPECIES: hypothetical protein [unclassified Massilia]MBQ5942861.1 hypothetical protein [Massilia sp. AB1]MBQ5962805.1 hypothetical protein [Massilia sp. ZL223]